MKVKELINLLSQENQEMRVVVNGYEEGFDEIDKICFVNIKRNLNKKEKYWQGEFDEVVRNFNFGDTEVALCFPRK